MGISELSVARLQLAQQIKNETKFTPVYKSFSVTPLVQNLTTLLNIFLKKAVSGTLLFYLALTEKAAGWDF